MYHSKVEIDGLFLWFSIDGTSSAEITSWAWACFLESELKVTFHWEADLFFSSISLLM